MSSTMTHLLVLLKKNSSSRTVRITIFSKQTLLRRVLETYSHAKGLPVSKKLDQIILQYQKCFLTSQCKLARVS